MGAICVSLPCAITTIRSRDAVTVQPLDVWTKAREAKCVRGTATTGRMRNTVWNGEERQALHG